MTVHAAFGGSTNLLLHVPAIAHQAGLRRPTVEDWSAINRRTPRLVDALPNGPKGYPTSYVYLAGGVPEVMLHLRRLGLLDETVLTVTGQPLGRALDWWEKSERRARHNNEAHLDRRGLPQRHDGACCIWRLDEPGAAHPRDRLLGRGAAADGR